MLSILGSILRYVGACIWSHTWEDQKFKVRLAQCQPLRPCLKREVSPLVPNLKEKALKPKSIWYLIRCSLNRDNTLKTVGYSSPGSTSWGLGHQTLLSLLYHRERRLMPSMSFARLEAKCSQDEQWRALSYAALFSQVSLSSAYITGTLPFMPRWDYTKPHPNPSWLEVSFDIKASHLNFL